MIIPRACIKAVTFAVGAIPMATTPALRRVTYVEQHEI